MFVGECKNGVHFVRLLPEEMYRLKEILPMDEREIDALLTDIAGNMSGNRVLESGYAVMWKWSSTPTNFCVVVWKEIGSVSGSGTEIGRVRVL